MKIKSVSALNLRALPDGHFEIGNGDPVPFAVFQGPPGSGKTLLLETLVASKEAAAPYGAVGQTAHLLRYGSTAGKVTVEWWLDDEERKYAGVSSPIQPCEVSFRKGALPEHNADPGLIAVLSRYDHVPSMGKVDYFPADRRYETDAMFGGDLVGEQRFLRLKGEARKYRGLQRFVREIVLGRETSRQEALTKLFGELANGVRYGGLTSTGQAEFILPTGEHVGHQGLSVSALHAFVFAATMVMLRTRNSVVLLDTPELGLGPGEAARRLAVLRAYEPSNQWLVATSDPEVIEMAKGAGIRLEGSNKTDEARK
jgi:hypothetical protein